MKGQSFTLLCFGIWTDLVIYRGTPCLVSLNERILPLAKSQQPT